MRTLQSILYIIFGLCIAVFVLNYNVSHRVDKFVATNHRRTTTFVDPVIADFIENENLSYEEEDEVEKQVAEDGSNYHANEVSEETSNTEKSDVDVSSNHDQFQEEDEPIVLDPQVVDDGDDDDDYIGLHQVPSVTMNTADAADEEENSRNDLPPPPPDDQDAQQQTTATVGKSSNNVDTSAASNENNNEDAEFSLLSDIANMIDSSTKGLQEVEMPCESIRIKTECLGQHACKWTSSSLAKGFFCDTTTKKMETVPATSKPELQPVLEDEHQNVLKSCEKLRYRSACSKREDCKWKYRSHSYGKYCLSTDVVFESDSDTTSEEEGSEDEAEDEDVIIKACRKLKYRSRCMKRDDCQWKYPKSHSYGRYCIDFDFGVELLTTNFGEDDDVDDDDGNDSAISAVPQSAKPRTACKKLKYRSRCQKREDCKWKYPKTHAYGRYCREDSVLESIQSEDVEVVPAFRDVEVEEADVEVEVDAETAMVNNEKQIEQLFIVVDDTNSNTTVTEEVENPANLFENEGSVENEVTSEESEESENEENSATADEEQVEEAEEEAFDVLDDEEEETGALEGDALTLIGSENFETCRKDKSKKKCMARAECQWKKRKRSKTHYCTARKTDAFEFPDEVDAAEQEEEEEDETEKEAPQVDEVEEEEQVVAPEERLDDDGIPIKVKLKLLHGVQALNNSEIQAFNLFYDEVHNEIIKHNFHQTWEENKKDISCKKHPECKVHDELAKQLGTAKLPLYKIKSCCRNHPHLRVMMHALADYFKHINFKDWWIDDTALVSMEQYNSLIIPWNNIETVSFAVDSESLKTSLMRRSKATYVSTMLKFNDHHHYWPYVLRACMSTDVDSKTIKCTMYQSVNDVPLKSKLLRYFVISDHELHEADSPEIRIFPRRFTKNNRCLYGNLGMVPTPISWIFPTKPCDKKFYGEEVRCPNKIKHLLDINKQDAWRDHAKIGSTVFPLPTEPIPLQASSSDMNSFFSVGNGKKLENELTNKDSDIMREYVMNIFCIKKRKLKYKDRFFDYLFDKRPFKRKKKVFMEIHDF